MLTDTQVKAVQQWTVFLLLQQVFTSQFLRKFEHELIHHENIRHTLLVTSIGFFGRLFIFVVCIDNAAEILLRHQMAESGCWNGARCSVYRIHRFCVDGQSG